MKALQSYKNYRLLAMQIACGIDLQNEMEANAVYHFLQVVGAYLKMQYINKKP